MTIVVVPFVSVADTFVWRYEAILYYEEFQSLCGHPCGRLCGSIECLISEIAEELKRFNSRADIVFKVLHTGFRIDALAAKSVENIVRIAENNGTIYDDFLYENQHGLSVATISDIDHGKIVKFLEKEFPGEQ